MGSGISKHDEDELKKNVPQQQPRTTAATSSSSTTSASASPRNTTNGIDNNNNNNDASSEGGCPMKRADGSYSYDWGALFRPKFPHGPGGSRPLTEQQQQASSQKTNDASSSGCPVQQQQHPQYNVYSQPISMDPKNNMPKTVANQMPAAGQTTPLSTERVVSNIPKGGAEDDKTTWTYPSPQMFYNALARKGKLIDSDMDDDNDNNDSTTGTTTIEQDMDNVVALHNNMNEKTWRKVMQWEDVIANGKDRSSSSSKLLKFQGRPTDLSPKALFKHYVLGHPLPYDRHDWTVVRPDGTTARYVIDYYYDESRASDEASSALPHLDDHSATPSLLVDVRPSLDTPTLAWNRFVTMPYARRIAQSTEFEPLPWQPTRDMKSQVSESVQVWQSIQQQAQGNAVNDNSNDQTAAEEQEEIMRISKQQAQQLATDFSKILVDCRNAQRKVDECQTEGDCARASMDLTLCMAHIACPLQHATLVQALNGDNSNNNNNKTAKDDDDATIDAALSRVHECVALKTNQHAAAQRQHPSLFE